MSPIPDGMDLLAAPPPDPAAGAVAEALRARYGLAGRLTPLPGERDRNVLVEGADGSRAVLKVHNAAEPPAARALGRAALLHLEGKALPFAVPRLIRTRDGAESCDVEGHEAVLTSFVAGAPRVADAPGPRRAAGAAAAALVLALGGFDPPAARRSLPWDLMRLDRLAPVAAAMPDRRRGDWLGAFAGRFAAAVRPAAEALPRGTLHNDLNPSNVLHGGDGVCGVIDFGDLLAGPRVVDLAVAASYGLGEDPAGAVADFAEGWMGAAPLTEDEAAALFDLALARLALRALVYAWRDAREGGEGGYHRRHAAPAHAALDRVMALPPGAGRDRVMARWRARRGRARSV